MRIALLAFPCLAAFASAQQPETPAPGEVVFRSSTQMVVETIGVTGKDGKPIEGLGAGDFTITENGKPQSVAFCEYQRLDAEPAEGPAPAAAPAPASRSGIAAGKPGALRYRDRRLLALYFDMSSMERDERWRALIAARNFITNRMAAPDVLAVLTFSRRGVRVRADFTADKDKLLRAVQSILNARGELEDDDDDASTAFGQDDEEFNLFTTDRQLSGLQTAVGMLGRLSEKKSIIYFASGVRFSGVQNLAQMRALTNAAIRANVAIFTVDSRGLIAEAPLGDASVPSPGGAGMYTGASAAAVASAREQSQDALYALAADTGGKALLDSNDLELGIVQAQKAQSSYYVVGFYTNNTTADGKFRRIVVDVKEYPSARLEYRHGYYGPKEFGKFNAAEKERQLEEALMLEDPVTDLTIAMEVNYFQINRAEYYVPVTLKIPGSELARARRGGAEHTRIEMIGEIKDDAGDTVQNLRDRLDIKLSDNTAAELARRSIEYDTGYTLLPGAYSIKVLARDDETGRIGTYMRKFVIPNLNKEDKRVAISSVVLSGQRASLREALATAGKDKEQANNPLVQDGLKLIPSVTRVFRANRELFVYLQAYDAGTPEAQPVVAYVTFLRGGAKGFETAPAAFENVVNPRLHTVPIKFSIPLSKLPPGTYECQVTVLNPANRKAAFWQTPIRIQ